MTTKIATIKNSTILDFINNNKSLENFVEVPSLIVAVGQENILLSMANQNYHFDVYVNYQASFNNSPVYSFELVFDDDLTETEYQLVK